MSPGPSLTDDHASPSRHAERSDCAFCGARDDVGRTAGGDEIARREIAEMLRAAARGVASAPAAAALLALGRGGAAPEASVIGKGLRVPVTHAALVNATAARDGGASGMAAVLVSAALAVAERDEVDGASFLLRSRSVWRSPTGLLQRSDRVTPDAATTSSAQRAVSVRRLPAA